MKIYLVETLGGGHGQGSEELIGCFYEKTDELTRDAHKNWWSITEYEVVDYNDILTKNAISSSARQND